MHQVLRRASLPFSNQHQIMRFINILAIWRYLIFCQIACGRIPRMRPMSIRQIINQISLLFWLPLSVGQRIKVHDSAAIHQFITLRRHFLELFLKQRRTERKMQEWFYYRFVRSMKHHHSPHRIKDFSELKKEVIAAFPAAQIFENFFCNLVFLSARFL